MTDVHHLDEATSILALGFDPLPAIAHALIAIAERMPGPQVLVVDGNALADLNPEELAAQLERIQPGRTRPGI